MSREVTYYCKAQDCDSHQTSTADPPITGWLLVLERLPSRSKLVEHDFCSWDCNMRYSATFDPPEVIEFPGAGEAAS